MVKYCFIKFTLILGQGLEIGKTPYTNIYNNSRFSILPLNALDPKLELFVRIYGGSSTIFNVTSFLQVDKKMRKLVDILLCKVARVSCASVKTFHFTQVRPFLDLANH